MRIAEGCGAQGELIQSLAAQASALAELKRPEDAIDVYRRALVLAEELAEHGSRRDAGALRGAQATFETLGARPWLARARGEAVTRGRANAR